MKYWDVVIHRTSQCVYFDVEEARSRRSGLLCLTHFDFGSSLQMAAVSSSAT